VNALTTPLPRAGAREGCADFGAGVGTLTQNRSSLWAFSWNCRDCRPPCIVDRARYLQAPEEPARAPKRLWRIRPDVNVVPVPPPVRKSNSKGTAVLNARRAGNAGKSEDSRPLRFWVKTPSTNSENRHNPPARPRARQGVLLVVHFRWSRPYGGALFSAPLRWSSFAA